jgi:hypothetical protein
VGVCLFLFAAVGLVDNLRDVKTALVKTGAGGKVGTSSSRSHHPLLLILTRRFVSVEAP